MYFGKNYDLLCESNWDALIPDVKEDVESILDRFKFKGTPIVDKDDIVQKVSIKLFNRQLDFIEKLNGRTEPQRNAYFCNMVKFFILSSFPKQSYMVNITPQNAQCYTVDDNTNKVKVPVQILSITNSNPLNEDNLKGSCVYEEEIKDTNIDIQNTFEKRDKVFESLRVVCALRSTPEKKIQTLLKLISSAMQKKDGKPKDIIQLLDNETLFNAYMLMKKTFEEFLDLNNDISDDIFELLYKELNISDEVAINKRIGDGIFISQENPKAKTIEEDSTPQRDYVYLYNGTTYYVLTNSRLTNTYHWVMAKINEEVDINE